MTLSPGLLCLALSSCAGSTTSQQKVVRGSTDIFTVACFYFDFDDVYVGSVRTALDQSLSTAGITYKEYDADNDQTTQNKQIDKAIAEGANVLVVNLVSSGNTEQADTICQEAEAAGIPIIFFNRPVEAPGYEGMILNYYDNIAYVGTDAEQGGRLQGEMIGDYLVEHYDEVDLNGDGRISYALFKGQAGNIGADYRTKYSVEVANEILAEHGYPELVYFDESSIDHFQLDLTGSWSLASAQDYMMTDLLYYNEDEGNMIELVIANSDAMAEGAINALQAFGYNDGEEGHTTIPVFGVDASEAGKKLIAQGFMTGTVKQDDHAMAVCISKLVQNVYNGKDLFYAMDDYPRDEENGIDAKILLPYSVYEPDDASSDSGEGDEAADESAGSTASADGSDASVGSASGA